MWARGSQASIRFFQIESQPHRLRIRARPHVVGETPVVSTLFLRHNGVTLPTSVDVLAGWQDYVVPLPTRFLSVGANELSLEFDRPPDDERSTGTSLRFAVDSIRFVDPHRDRPATPGNPRGWTGSDPPLPVRGRLRARLEPRGNAVPAPRRPLWTTAAELRDATRAHRCRRPIGDRRACGAGRASRGTDPTERPPAACGCRSISRRRSSKTCRATPRSRTPACGSRTQWCITPVPERSGGPRGGIAGSP